MTITRIDSGKRMSQAAIHNGTVYLAGLAGAPEGTTTHRTETIFVEVERLLERAGSKGSRADGYVCLADMANFAEMNVAWDAWMEDISPLARARVQAGLAQPGYRIKSS